MIEDIDIELQVLQNPLPKEGTAVRIFREPSAGAFVLVGVIFFDRNYKDMLRYVEEYLQRYCEAGDYTVEFVDIKSRREKRKEMRFFIGIKDVEL